MNGDTIRKGWRLLRSVGLQSPPAEVGVPGPLWPEGWSGGKCQRYLFDQPITLNQGDTMTGGGFLADGTIAYRIERANGEVETIIGRPVES